MAIRNIKIILQYDGSRYNGWQKQGNTDNTIQGKLESILSRYFGQEIEVHGSGRTDAGVHAGGQVANFKYDDRLWSASADTDTARMLSELNSYLPEDIKINSLMEADIRFHARLNAKRKHYRYYLSLNGKRDVFKRKYMALCREGENLDIERMKAASRLLIGTHDFAGFSDNKSKKNSTVRELESIEFSLLEDGAVLAVDFIGNGFLYHMVRLLMGTLMDIGFGHSNEKLITDILDSKDRKRVPFMAAAEGLFLQEVWY